MWLIRIPNLLFHCFAIFMLLYFLVKSSNHWMGRLLIFGMLLLFAFSFYRNFIAR